MKINHVAIYVNNLEKTKEFYVKYFQAKANEKYHNKKTGLQCTDPKKLDKLN